VPRAAAGGFVIAWDLAYPFEADEAHWEKHSRRHVDAAPVANQLDLAEFVDPVVCGEHTECERGSGDHELAGL
jgi:hypothetical protein